MERFSQQLRAHPEQGRRLVWLEDADDAALDAWYRCCDGVILPSRGEGFGLPLSEAQSFGKPVLARDIPIFREVAMGEVTFFAGESLRPALASWSRRLRDGAAPASRVTRPSWRECGAELISLVTGPSPRRPEGS